MQNIIEVNNDTFFFFYDLKELHLRDVWFIQNLRQKYLENNILKNKKIIFYIYQEIFLDTEIMPLVDDLIKNFEVKLENIYFLDATLYSSHPYRKNKLRTPGDIITLYAHKNDYVFIFDDYKNQRLVLDAPYENEQLALGINLEKTRDKKFCFFNFKTDTALRHIVFSELIHNYNYNIDSILKDGIITFRQGVNLPVYNDNFIMKNYSGEPIIDIYKKANILGKIFRLPDLDENKEIIEPGIAQNFHKDLFLHMKKSYFSIVCETKFNHEYTYQKYWKNYDENYSPTQLQMSEKIMMPIGAQNLIWIVEDKNYYRKLEEYGFNFSYLKEIFGIDYLNNSFIKNLKETDKVIKYIKNNSNENIYSIKKQYSHITFNNYTKLIQTYAFREYNFLSGYPFSANIELIFNKNT